MTFLRRHTFVVLRVNAVELAGETSVLAPSIARCRRGIGASLEQRPCPSPAISRSLGLAARPAEPIAAGTAMLFAHAFEAIASPRRRGLAQHDV